MAQVLLTIAVLTKMEILFLHLLYGFRTIHIDLNVLFFKIFFTIVIVLLGS